MQFPEKTSGQRANAVHVWRYTAVTLIRTVFTFIPALALAYVFVGLPARAAEEVLEESGLKAVVDTTTGAIRVETAGRVVIPSLKLGGGGAFTKAEWVMLNEPLGAARALALGYDNHRSVLLAIFPGRPFVCLRQQITNPEELDKDFTSETVAEAVFDAGADIAQLRSFGTAGLATLDKHPGSYMYQAVVNPADGSGLVGGWISSDRGSGVLFTPVFENRPTLKAVTEYGRLKLRPRTSEKGEWLAIGWFADARFGLEAYADAVADYHGVKLRPQPSGYCTWYSDPHGGAGDQTHLAELAEFTARELKPYGFSFLQIDDKWQRGERRNGPAKDFTTAQPDGPYPAGMKAAADTVASQGLRPGLWFMPFAGDHLAENYRDKPDWFVKNPEGKIFETEWGGSSIDLSQPAAREHLRGLVRTFVKDWGFSYLKMDGLYTGLGVAQLYVHQHYREDGFGKQSFSDPYQTPVEIFRSGLSLIREEAGPSTYLLGCCIPQNLRSLGASYGLVHAMRIGADNGAKWKNGDEAGAIVGPINGTRRWFLHNRVWHNDPDPVYVRPSLSLDQARQLATWTAVSGQLNTHSEWTPGLPPERLDILKRTMPPHGLTARPQDVFERDPARVWVVKGPGQGPLGLAIYNWDSKPLEFTLPLARVGLDAMGVYDAWEFWGNKPMLGLKGELKLKLAPTSCAVLVLRPRQNIPVVLSTSRHVLQTLVGHSAETWNGEKKLLAATCATVGKDACEIRILLPDEGKNWTDGSVVLAEADAAAGVRASLARDGAFLRLRLESPDNRDINWAIQW